MNEPVARPRLPLLIALLPAAAVAQAQTTTALPTVEVQAARVQGIDPFALPASQDTVWVDDDRSGASLKYLRNELVAIDLLSRNGKEDLSRSQLARIVG